MKSIRFIIVVAVMLVAAGLVMRHAPTESSEIDVPEVIVDSVPAYAQKLMKAYPEKITAYKSNYIFFSDGDSLVFDDSVNKGYLDRLDYADIQDMMCQEYTRDSIPEYLNDAGRARSDAFFRKMYGSTESEARSSLVSVDWFGGKVMFTSVNGAAENLRKVESALLGYPGLIDYLKGASTFNWRKVRGAERMSAHSYGIAIDINVKWSDYWLWSNKNVAETDSIGYKNRIPLKIVEVFEDHGFIWGGRWYHYDTMHFEYRPELL